MRIFFIAVMSVFFYRLNTCILHVCLQLYDTTNKVCCSTLTAFFLLLLLLFVCFVYFIFFFGLARWTNIMCSRWESFSFCFHTLIYIYYIYVRTRVWYAVNKEHQHRIQNIREYHVRVNNFSICWSMNTHCHITNIARRFSVFAMLSFFDILLVIIFFCVFLQRILNAYTLVVLILFFLSFETIDKQIKTQRNKKIS